MSYQDTRGLLDFLLAQVSAESFLDDAIDDDLLIKERLKLGPTHYQFKNKIKADEKESSTKSTDLMQTEFLDTWEILHQLPNTESGLSVTILKHRESGEITFSFRSTESNSYLNYGGDMERDGPDAADGEIKNAGFAFGQIANMETYIKQLKAGSGDYVDNISADALAEVQVALDSNESINVTGYSLGGHLAQIFTLLHYQQVNHTYVFNGAGFGNVDDFANDISGQSTGLNALLNKYKQIFISPSDFLDEFSYFELLNALNSVSIPYTLSDTASGNAHLLQMIVDEHEEYEAKKLLNPSDYRNIYTEDPLHILAVSLLDDDTSDSDVIEITERLGWRESTFDGADGSSKVTNFFGHASSWDMEFVAMSGQTFDTGNKVFIEDQEEYGGVDMSADGIANKLLKSLGATHSITLIIDSIMLTELLQRVDGTKTRDELESLYRAASNEIASPEGSAVEGHSLENVLDALGRILDPTWVKTNAIDTKGGFANLSMRNGYHDGILELRNYLTDNYPGEGSNSIGESPFKIESIIGRSVSELVESAETDIAYRYALVNLNPFALSGDDAVYNVHNTNGELDIENFSTIYLKDRAEFLAMKLERNLIDIPDSGFVHRPDRYEIYEDLLTETTIKTYAFADEVDVYKFGSEDANTTGLDGGAYNDHLYGAGGNDTIHGNAGRDHIEGNADNDTLYGDAGTDYVYGGKGNDHIHGGTDNDFLYGGEGSDTYYYTTGDGHDQINDADAGDRLNINGSLISSITRISENSNLYEDDDGNTYSLGDTGGLVITVKNDDTDQSGTITIDTFDKNANNFGIAVEEPDEPVAPQIIGNIFIVGRGVLSEDAPIKITYDERFSDPKQFFINDASIIYDATLIPNNEPNSDFRFEGGNKNDRMTGSVLFDVLDGFGGDDYIDGLENNDRISGGAGNDYLLGGDGTDFIWGNEERLLDEEGLPMDDYQPEAADTADYIEGGNGVDHISADEGDDTVLGGQGNDVIAGGQGNDQLFGGENDDFVLGDSYREYWLVHTGLATTISDYLDIKEDGIGYDDVIDGGEGDDHLLGEIGNDTILGGSGNDWIHGDRHNRAESLVINDQIDEQFQLLAPELHGDDVLMGGSGDDVILGDAGDDYLDGGSENDMMWGDDIYINGQHHGRDVLAGGTGDDVAIGGGNDDLIHGGNGNDTLIGDESIYDDETEMLLEGQYHGNDEIHGGIGNDDIIGGGKDDVLYGDEGDDFIWGDSKFTSDQVFDAGKEVPIPNGAWWLDTTHHGQDLIYAGSGDDRVYGGGGSDTVYGGSGSDSILGQDGDDTLHGEAGNDLLFGGDGSDIVFGGSGNDTLYGGAGDDILHAGSGQDYLDGDLGNDTYVFNTGDGASTIDDADGQSTLVFNDITDSSQIKVYAGETYSVVQYGPDVNDKIFLTNETYLNLAGVTLADGSTLDSLPVQLDEDDNSRKITGTPGNDTFVINAGFDSLTLVNNGDTNTTDTLKFGEGITPDNIQLTYHYGLMGDPEHLDPDYHSVSVRLESGDVLNLENFVQNNGSAAIDQFEFSNGEVWSLADFKQQLFTAKDSNNAVHGSPWDEVLTGGAGEDYLFADKGNDMLLGGDGRDTLDAGDGDDILDGGADSDILIGGLGNDRYRFGANHGQDEIQLDNDPNGYEVIEFDQTIAPDQVYFTRRENSLRVHTSYSDYINIANAFDGDSYLVSAIDEIRFDDGTIWTSAQLVSKLNQGTMFNDQLDGSSLDDAFYGLAGHDTITGQGGDDTLFGGDGHDELDGGTGNDILVGGTGSDDLMGGAGQDIYQYALGDGSDYILRETDDVSSDILKMMPGIAPDDVQLFRNGMSLRIFIESTDSYITVIDFFESGNRSQPVISEILFDDDTRWAAADIFDQLDSSTGGDDQLYGDAGDNFIEGLAGDDRLYGRDGNDTIEGGDGDDILQGENGDDILSGGSGKDHLNGGTGDDIYLANNGDGQDYISQRYSAITDNDVIRFGADITPDDVTFTIDGSNYTDLVMFYNGGSFWGGDSLWVHDFWNGHGSLTTLSDTTIDSFQFQDGTVWSADFIQAHIFTPTERSNFISLGDENNVIDALGGNDEVWGRGGDDQLSGSNGNDSLWGGDGSDTLSGGDGNDSLYGNSGDDTIVAGAGDDAIAGGSGNDTIVARQGDNEIRFSLGDGQDVIEVGHDDGGVTRLGFQWGIASSSLTYQLNARDLVIGIEGTQDSVTLKNYLTENLLNISDDYVLFEVHFSDEETVYGAEDLSTLDLDSIPNPNPIPNHAPVVSQVMADVESAEGTMIDFTLPASTFTDANAGDVLSYTATLADDSALPDWLSFDGTTFSGTPENSDVGNLSIKVTASDGQASVSTDFNLTVTNVNDAPVVEQGISDLSIAEEAALSLAIPADAFSDLDGDTLTYSATLSDGSALPGWLSFDGSSFTGSPGINDDGDLIVKVTASDGQASAATHFNLTVTHTNHAPVLSLSLADQSGAENEAFSFTLPAESFTDVDTDDSLGYHATLSDGSPLPSWLSFDANTLTFSGTPGSGDDGNINIEVTATDQAGASIGDIFELVIAPASGPDISSDPVNFVGTSADEVVYGSNFDDNIDGQFGDDTLYGHDGADELKGYFGNDRIIGGAGNDTLNGLFGSDTYVFNLGDGQDTISEYGSASDINVIEFGAGILPEDLVFRKSSNGTNLEIVIGEAGDLITLKSFYSSSSYGPNKPFISEIQFDNGVVLNQTDLAALIPAVITEDIDWINGDDGNNTIAGLGGNDVIFSRAGDDSLEGGAGNDSLYGDAGNDTYVYNTGDGDDIISDTKGINRLVIDGQTISHITPTNAELTRYQDAAGNLYEVNSFGWLIVTIGTGATAGRIMIVGWDQNTNHFGISMQAYSNQSPEAVDDAGSTNENTPLVFTAAELLSNDSDPEGDPLSLTSVSNALNGTAILDSVAGTVTFTPDAGYIGTASFDYMLSDGELTDAGSVNITVSAEVVETNDPDSNVSSDPVSFVGTSTDEVVYGSHSADTIDGQFGDDSLFGFDGDDNLKGYVGNDLMVGGKGNDTLNGSLGSDTYRFNLGDGQDTISEYRSASDINVIEFGAGIEPGDLSFQKSSNGLSLEVVVGSGGDKITLLYFYGSSYDPEKPFIGEMRFENGSIYTSSALDTLIPGLMSEGKDFIIGNADDNVFDSLGGNDTVMAGAGNDSLAGGAGDDWLYGQAGDDTYHFKAGDGFDTIHAQSGSSETDFETLVFDDQFDVNNLWFTQKSNNLEIHLLGTDDKIRIYNWFTSEQHELDQIQSGSSTIDNAGIEQLINSMAAFGSPSGGEISLSAEEKNQVDTAIAAAWQ